MFHRLLAISAAAVLAGCGSSSSTGARDFDAVSARFDALNTAIDPLPATTILPGGSASYAGLARIDYALDGAPRVLLGDAALSVDFDAGTVSGDLSHFVDSGAGAVEGQIAMTGGVISAARIEGLAVGGALGVGGRTLAFQGTGRGQFKGEDAEAARVQMGGAGGGPDQPGWSGAAYLRR